MLPWLAHQQAQMHWLAPSKQKSKLFISQGNIYPTASLIRPKVNYTSHIKRAVGRCRRDLTRGQAFSAAVVECVSQNGPHWLCVCGSVGRGHQCAHRGGRGTAVPAVQTAGHDPDQPWPPQQPGEGRAITVTSCMLYCGCYICIYLHIHVILLM